MCIGDGRSAEGEELPGTRVPAHQKLLARSRVSALARWRVGVLACWRVVRALSTPAGFGNCARWARNASAAAIVWGCKMLRCLLVLMAIALAIAWLSPALRESALQALDSSVLWSGWSRHRRRDGGRERRKRCSFYPRRRSADVSRHSKLKLWRPRRTGDAAADVGTPGTHRVVATNSTRTLR